jgi:hypothetical protein
MLALILLQVARYVFHGPGGALELRSTARTSRPYVAAFSDLRILREQIIVDEKSWRRARRNTSSGK